MNENARQNEIDQSLYLNKYSLWCITFKWDNTAFADDASNAYIRFNMAPYIKNLCHSFILLWKMRDWDSNFAFIYKNLKKKNIFC